LLCWNPFIEKTSVPISACNYNINHPFDRYGQIRRVYSTTPSACLGECILPEVGDAGFVLAVIIVKTHARENIVNVI